MIQQINGLPVYVIQAEPVEIAKTSAGGSYSEMYSQLRWQIYEDIYEEITAQNEWNRESYDSQMDAYEAAAKDIRDRVEALQKLRQDVIDSGRMTVDQSIRLHQGNKDDALAGQRIRQSARPSVRITDQIVKDEYGEPMTDAEGNFITRPVETITQDYYGRDEAGELITPPAPSGGVSALSKEQVMADVDPVDTTDLDEQIAQLEAELAGLDRPTAPTRLTADDAKRQFREQVGVIGEGGGPFGVAAEPQRPVREQLESNRELMQGRRQRPSEEVARTPAADAQAEANAAADEELNAALEDAASEDGTQEENGKVSPDLRFMTQDDEEQATTEVNGKPVETNEAEREAIIKQLLEEETAGQPVQGEPPTPEAPEIEFAPSADSVVAPNLLGGRPIDRVDAATPTDEVFEPTTEATTEETPKAAPAPNRQQRKNKYIANVAKGAMDLVNKPKKLQRLAKTNLDESDRPSWAVVVDKLNTVNKGKPNGTLNTYQELARHFRDDPKTMRQAHEYAMAKSILDSEDSTPLA